MSNDIKKYRKLLENIENGELLDEGIKDFFNNLISNITKKDVPFEFKDVKDLKFVDEVHGFLSSLFGNDFQFNKTITITDEQDLQFNRLAIQYGFDRSKIREGTENIYYLPCAYVLEPPTDNTSGSYEYVAILCAQKDLESGGASFIATISHIYGNVSNKAIIKKLNKRYIRLNK